MRMINYALLAGAALFAATAANATTTITFDDGIGNLQPGEVSYADFNTLPTSGTITAGINFAFLTGSGPQGAQPATGDQGDRYLSVGTFLPSGFATFDFTAQAGGGVRQLGMDYGSADTYNSFVLHLSDGTIETYTGTDAIVNGVANGNQSSTVTNGRLTFRPDGGLYITSIDLRSTGQALEADNFGVIAAVPEPATWGMMLLGFGVMGVSLRRRRRSTPALAQAV